MDRYRDERAMRSVSRLRKRGERRRLAPLVSLKRFIEVRDLRESCTTPRLAETTPA
jgi:hypothetical protein